MLAPNGKTLTRHQEVVIRYMQPGRTLTNIVAITCLGIGSLSSRIAELRKMGFKIAAERDVDDFDRSYFKYTMEPEDNHAID